MNEFAFKYEYNCKLILRISSRFVTEQVAFYNCKYCSTVFRAKFHDNGVIFFLNMNVIVSTSSNEITYV